MARYTDGLVIVEAVQYDGFKFGDEIERGKSYPLSHPRWIPLWIRDIESKIPPEDEACFDGATVVIGRKLSNLRVSATDFVVRLATLELIVVQFDVFRATYTFVGR